jgi:hypothetical protein
MMEISDHEKLTRELPVYDVLYVYCGGPWPIPSSRRSEHVYEKG